MTTRTAQATPDPPRKPRPRLSASVMTVLPPELQAALDVVRASGIRMVDVFPEGPAS